MKGRIAGDHIDSCRAAVKSAIRDMRGPAHTNDLYGDVHQAVSVHLNKRLNAVRYHHPHSKVLPETLHATIGHRKAEMTLVDFEPMLKLRASQWCKGVIELLGRMERDWPQLVEHFGLNPDAAMIAISEPLGDPHNGGRSVCKVSFSDGNALIYKPRSVMTERAFGQIVEWLQQGGCEPQLRWCRTLPREGYGWAEYVPQVYCRTVEEAERYYERQGAFLALFFLLRGTDCIAENVVTHGEHPVWVDVECLCRPKLRDDPPLPVERRRLPWIRRSVLHTALLYYVNAEGFRPRGITALSHSCLEDRSAVFTQHDILRDRYIAAVQRGFRGLYTWSLRHRGEWTNDHGPLACFSQQRVRFLARSTAFYLALGNWLCIAPTAERPYVLQSIEELLRVDGSWSPSYRGLIPAELAALDQFDVPYWDLATDSRDFREASGAVVPDVATQPGLDCLRDHLAQMSEQDMSTQLWLIDGYLRLPVGDHT